MLLSCDLMPDDNDGTALMSPRHLGTVKASLRFTKPLPVTTTLLAYAQYDNLVVVDAYRTVTFDYNAWCSGGNFRRPSWEALVGVYTWEEPWSLPLRFPAAYLIITAHSGTAGEHWVGDFLEDSRHAEYFDSYGTAPLESIYQRLRGMGYRDVRYSTKMPQGPFYAFYFLAMRSRSVPLGAVTAAFREYDFPYNEAMIRCLLG